MPIKVVAYRCKYKCYYPTTASKKKVERHEGACLRNPDRKACLTCKNWDDYTDDNGMNEPYRQTWSVSGCDLELIPEGKKMIVNCEKWESK